LAVHDTDNLQTVFGSDLLRITPAEKFADIYCLNESEVEETLAPIQDTVIIGPPEDCGREEEVQRDAVVQRTIEPELKKARRPAMYESPPQETREMNGASNPLMQHNGKSEHRESVPYGGTVVRPIHLCENCLQHYEE